MLDAGHLMLVTGEDSVSRKSSGVRWGTECSIFRALLSSRGTKRRGDPRDNLLNEIAALRSQ